MLLRILEKLPLSCQHVTKVLTARTPLVKFVDAETGLDVDFCINNKLGFRNTLLLSAYNDYDARVRNLARFVKDWAKANQVIGTPEGYLNSYAYVILVIYYLQQSSPPVLPHNLQLLATESAPIDDLKWNYQDRWETKFFSDVSSLSPSGNSQSLGELMVGFFKYYSNFDWSRHAVCMRLSRPQVPVDKFSLHMPTHKDQWYVEDPFDLRHNLAGQCTAPSKQRLLQYMSEAATALTKGKPWCELADVRHSYTGPYFVKCRVTAQVKPDMMVHAFSPFGLVRLHYPRTRQAGVADWVEPQAFLEFATAQSRRAAHCLNEDILGGSSISMLDSSQLALSEAGAVWEYTVIEVPAAPLSPTSPTSLPLAAAVAVPSDDEGLL